MNTSLLSQDSAALSRACFDLVPAGTGDPVMAHWGGRRSDLRDGRHVLSVDQAMWERLGLRVPRPMALARVSASNSTEGLPAVPLSTGTLGEVQFENSVPLTFRPAISLPPFEALVLYGGPAVQAWLSAQGLERWDYEEVDPEVRERYRDVFEPSCPLYLDDPPYARLGGWHVMWPEDDFYLPREMRLLVWTFRDAEPWYEVFLSPTGNVVVKGRIT